MVQGTEVPERLPLHLIIGDAVVDESLVPHGVQGGFKGLGAKLVSLRARREETHLSDMTKTEFRLHVDEWMNRYLTGPR